MTYIQYVEAIESMVGIGRHTWHSSFSVVYSVPARLNFKIGDGVDDYLLAAHDLAMCGNYILYQFVYKFFAIITVNDGRQTKTRKT